MPSQVKFFRGSESSLPQEQHDGAIYVVDTGEAAVNGLTRGELYVDSGIKRLRIGAQPTYIYTESQMSTLIGIVSKRGAIYIVTDSNGDQVGVKIGDGSAYIIDLPMVDFLSIQKHVKAYTAPIIDEINSGSGEVRLILAADVVYSD